MYDFSGYRAFVQVAKRMGLKLQAVMSFHACGANVGDTAQVPLPEWVLKVWSLVLSFVAVSWRSASTSRPSLSRACCLSASRP